MKRVFMIALLMSLYANVIGQELKLLSIAESSTEITSSKTDRFDLNGIPAAIMVLSFQNPINNLSFKGNIIEKEITNECTYTLYIADKTKRITIQHEDLYPFVLDFKNNGINIEGGHRYLVKIENNMSSNNYTKKQEVGAQYLVFKYTNNRKSIKKITVNREEWEVSGYSSSKLVPFGTYKYEVELNDGRILAGEVMVKSKLGSKVVQLEF